MLSHQFNKDGFNHDQDISIMMHSRITYERACIWYTYNTSKLDIVNYTTIYCQISVIPQAIKTIVFHNLSIAT